MPRDAIDEFLDQNSSSYKGDEIDRFLDEKRAPYTVDRVSATEELAKTKEKRAGTISDEARATPIVKDVTPIDLLTNPAMSIGRQIANSALKKNPSISEKLQAVSRGGLNTILAGIPDAIASKSGVNLNSAEDPTFREPYSASVGEVGGVGVPLGELTAIGKAKGALPTIARLLRPSITGGTYLAGNKISQSIQENPNISADEALKKTIEGFGQGSILGPAAVLGTKLGIKGVQAGEKVASNVVTGIRNKAGDLVSSIVGGKGDERTIQGINSGKYVSLIPDISKFKEAGSGTTGLIDASQKLWERDAQEIAPVIQNADAAKYFDVYDLYTKLDNRLKDKIPVSSIRSQAINHVLPYIEEIKPSNALSYQGALNNDLNNFYKKGQPEQAANITEAKEAARDVLGGVIKQILKDEKVEPKNYSRLGLIEEFSDLVSKRYGKAAAKQSSMRGDEIIPRAVKGLRTGASGLNVGEAAINVAAPYTGGEQASIDRQVERLFNEVNPETSSQKLQSAAQNASSKSLSSQIPNEILLDYLLKKAAQTSGETAR